MLAADPRPTALDNSGQQQAVFEFGYDISPTIFSIDIIGRLYTESHLPTLFANLPANDDDDFLQADAQQFIFNYDLQASTCAVVGAYLQCTTGVDNVAFYVCDIDHAGTFALKVGPAVMSAADTAADCAAINLAVTIES